MPPSTLVSLSFISRQMDWIRLTRRQTRFMLPLYSFFLAPALFVPYDPSPQSVRFTHFLLIINAEYRRTKQGISINLDNNSIDNLCIFLSIRFSIFQNLLVQPPPSPFLDTFTLSDSPPLGPSQRGPLLSSSPHRANHAQITSLNLTDPFLTIT